MTASAAAPTRIKGTSITTPTESGDNHTLVLGQLKEVAEIGQRLRGDPKDSFVRVGELVSATGARLVNGTIQPPSSTTASAGTVTATNSITGDGSSGTPLKLVGDSASPGNNMVYGTNGAGVKSWYAAGAVSSPLTTKGDIYGFTSANARVPVGSNGQVLTADSAAAPGVSWQASSGGTASTTPDTHPLVPTGVGLGPNDEFETGSSIDTAGTRYASATAWTAFGTALTNAVASGALVFAAPVAGANRINGWTQPVPGGAWTYNVKVAQQATTSASSLGGIFIATASGTAGKNVCLGVSGTNVTIQRNTNNTTFSSNPFNGSTITVALATTGALTTQFPYVYLQINYDGTNLNFSISSTGVPGTYQQFYTETTAAFLGTPGMVGIGAAVFATPGNYIFDWFRRTA